MLVIAVLCTVLASTLGSFCNQDGYSIVFEDDFEGTMLNTTRWTTTLGFDGGQGRDAYLLNKNAYLEDGNLVLRSMKDDYGFNYTSGAVTTKDKFSFRHGRVCFNAQLPGQPGKSQGVWPAHWMMPNDASCWPDHGEIDVLEMINGDGSAHGTFHWNRNFPGTNCTGDSGNTAVTGNTNVDNWHSSYHEYAAEWDESSITFLVDGVAYANVTATSPGNPGGQHPQFPPNPMYLILNTAIGGPWPGPPSSDTVFPVYHRIDYVRVSQPINSHSLVSYS
eukprot:m.69249 g.69249  ORF g.69249 m.69249 type:complete len:277 (-) comp14111_c0_seq1:2186-3016(-)